MDTAKSGFEKLPLELLLELSYFFDLDSFMNFRSSCKQLLNTMNSTKFISVYLKENPILKAINLHPPPSDTQRFFNQVFRQLVTQSDVRSGSCPDPLEIESVAASTTERNQFIYFTEQDYGFWCSLGTPDENKEEYLLYKLNSEVAVPAFVFIEFAFFSHITNGNQIFPSKYVQIEFSFVPNKPIYTTSKYELKPEIKDRTIEIPILPNVIAARYMKVKFLGMQTRHVRRDNLFYICVERVLCFGHKIKKSDNKTSFGDLIHRSVQYFYSSASARIKPDSNTDIMEEELSVKSFGKSELDSLMIDESKPEEEVLELIDIGYDIERHNQLLLKAFRAEGKNDLMNLVSQNLHLLDSEAFFKFLTINWLKKQKNAVF